ncbi:MAG: hypothetical protein B9S34_08555 [Opitutia bacterium Tous-C1TDCM]|nr:MAG: hypothetical protein B9S34_08555 [Opitutae bacterium Tous-C1TDCM]
MPASRPRLRRRTVAGLGLAAALAAAAAAPAADENVGVEDPRHRYAAAPHRDRFAAFKADWDARRIVLRTDHELDFLRSLLAALEIPVSSQMLVTSATSLQKGRITPRNPRALYFNDDTYVGFVPGGQIEVISLDPELGGIFYIFERLAPGRPPAVDRADDCLTCHAPFQLGQIPALLVESVVPGHSGGGEKAFRRGESGHGVALGDRFGGYHVTGAGPAFPRHWGDLIVERKDGVAVEVPNPIGRRFDLARYPAPTSDLLAQLLHEHQAGFANRLMAAVYRWRALGFAGSVPAASLDAIVAPLVGYLLFADEVPLPGPGALGISPFTADFAAGARRDPAGRALRDLDGRTRLLRYRCSYLVYSAPFAGLPEPLRQPLLARLAAALADGPDPVSRHLPAEERMAIREILAATLPGFPDAAR